MGKEYAQKQYVQYNAVMLVRILCDNPGPRFTRNFDASFVKAVKELLRNSKNDGTQQLLRQMLNALEVNKSHDEGLQGLLHMWRKEMGHAASLSHRPNPRSAQSGSATGTADPYATTPTPNHATVGPVNRTLPPPQELANRIEEARNTAKILLQFIQSTPTEEVLSNELIREFGDRCQSAQRSMQVYINCQNPEPDHDTMQTLIETNEQLSLAGSRYQRALLSARRAMGISPSPSNAPQQGMHAPTAFRSPSEDSRQSAFGPSGGQIPAPTNGIGPQQSLATSTYQAPLGPPPNRLQSQPHAPHLQPVLDRSRFSYTEPHQPASDPFADPVEHNRNPAPSVIQSSTYGSTQRQQSPQTFNIDSEPTYATVQTGTDTSNTSHLATPVSGAPSSPPNRPHAATGDSQYDLSPQGSPQVATSALQASPSLPRPGPGPWHHSNVTQSYIGRQASALNGLTMHGAQSEEDVPEIDGNSQVGRKDQGQMRTSAFGITR